jgi:hypothetical protein
MDAAVDCALQLTIIVCRRVDCYVLHHLGHNNK